MISKNIELPCEVKKLLSFQTDYTKEQTGDLYFLKCTFEIDKNNFDKIYNKATKEIYEK